MHNYLSVRVLSVMQPSQEHNGVVDAPEPGRESDEPTQSSSRSSSAAPSSKGKERENSTVPMTEPVVGKSLSSLATPVTSYYRQHTANNSSYPPRPATYAQVSLPTSSARTDGYPWPEGQAPPPLGGLHLMYITPYYRTNTVTAPPPLLTPVSQSFTDLSSHRKSSIDSKSPDSPKSVSSTSTNAVDNDTSMVDPPSLPIHRSPSPENREFRQFLSEAGMEAVTANDDEYASRQSVDVDRRPDAWRREESPLDSSRHTERFPNPEGNRDRIRNYTSRPMSLLTGDGGAILNPVDLLTQESLAPPEPS
ncbi:hypothetical protein VNI00_010006 [Paramarasmius palmivorus]|uniref:Uncharacterized protein n=1 Tax=Paramarasmius palmivorus TaxID=297713 RepID=A0AAW0CMS8_9AGAR